MFRTLIQLLKSPSKNILSLFAAMCESHTINHLCGHIKIKTIVQCAEMTEMLLESSTLNKKAGLNGERSRLSEPKETPKCTHQLCAEVVDTLHIFPDLCDQCKRAGVVGDWMEKERGLKLQILRSWKSKRRETTQSPWGEAQLWTGSNADNATEGYRDDSDKLECDAIPSISNGTTTTSMVHSPDSSARSIPSSVTSASTAPSFHDLKARVQRLRARTDQLIAKIRVQRAARTMQCLDKQI